MTAARKTTVSATEARVHFGEMMRRAEDGETLLVERAGRAMVVMISMEEYARLIRDTSTTDPIEERLRATRERYLREAADVHYDVERDIRQMREERAREIDEHLR